MGRDPVDFDRANPRCRTGIWRSQAYTEREDSYAADEITFVFEGELTPEADGFLGNLLRQPRVFRDQGGLRLLALARRQPEDRTLLVLEASGR